MIVDHDARVVAKLGAMAEAANYRVSAHLDFGSARDALGSRPGPIAALVANVRLGEFNGIHLVYLAKMQHPKIRALVYAKPHDPILALEAQQASAFYQRQAFLPFSLASFLRAGLPTNDRRTVSGFDRRTEFRGGRRTTDLPELALGTI